MVITRKSLHQTVLNEICEELSYATSTSPTQKLHSGTMQRILKQYKKEHPWLNCDKINFHYRKYKKDSSQSEQLLLVMITTRVNNKIMKSDQKIVDLNADLKVQLKL